MRKIVVLLLVLLVVLAVSGRTDLPVWTDITQWPEHSSPAGTGPSEPKERTPEEGGRHIYTWTDAKGVVHFSDRRPPAGQEAEVIAAQDYLVDTVSPDKAPSPKAAARSARKKKRRPKAKKRTRRQGKPEGKATGRVEIYTSDHCGYCTRAVAFLRAQNIPFTEYNIERSRAAKKRMRAAGGVRHVPFAVINGRKIRGFAEGTYRRALNLPERDPVSTRATGRAGRTVPGFRSSGRT